MYFHSASFSCARRNSIYDNSVSDSVIFGDYENRKCTDVSAIDSFYRNHHQQYAVSVPLDVGWKTVGICQQNRMKCNNTNGVAIFILSLRLIGRIGIGPACCALRKLTSIKSNVRWIYSRFCKRKSTRNTYSIVTLENTNEKSSNLFKIVFINIQSTHFFMHINHQWALRKQKRHFCTHRQPHLAFENRWPRNLFFGNKTNMARTVRSPSIRWFPASNVFLNVQLPENCCIFALHERKIATIEIS